MSISEPLSSEERNCIETLRTADRRTLKTIFEGLKPPAVQQFAGEFDAELLNQGGRISNLLTSAVFGIHGPWIGKAFYPTDESRGTGYNCFRYGTTVTPKLFMETWIADSNLTSGQSMFIDYRSRNRGPIRWLVGELRVVIPTVILGIGCFGPRFGRRDRWRRKIPFVMLGPRREYQVDSAA